LKSPPRPLEYLGATLIFSAGMMIPFVKVSVFFDHFNELFLRRGKQPFRVKKTPDLLFKTGIDLEVRLIQKKQIRFFTT
jgi:hypothetical protein